MTTASSNIYANFLKLGLTGTHINLNSDLLKVALLSSGYSPNLTSDTYWADIKANEITGSGYTAGGASVSGASVSLTAANSWSTTWTATTNYSYGTVIAPSTPNGLLYRCVSAGVSGSVSPTFPTTEGQAVSDSGTIWACIGDAILVFTSGVAQWTGATFSANYAVLYDALGAASVSPLVVLNSFAATQSASVQTYQVIPDPTLGWLCFSPPS